MITISYEGVGGPGRTVLIVLFQYPEKSNKGINTKNPKEMCLKNWVPKIEKYDWS